MLEANQQWTPNNLLAAPSSAAKQSTSNESPSRVRLPAAGFGVHPLVRRQYQWQAKLAPRRCSGTNLAGRDHQSGRFASRRGSRIEVSQATPSVNLISCTNLSKFLCNHIQKSNEYIIKFGSVYESRTRISLIESQVS